MYAQVLVETSSQTLDSLNYRKYKWISLFVWGTGNFVMAWLCLVSASWLLIRCSFLEALANKMSSKYIHIKSPGLVGLRPSCAERLVQHFWFQKAWKCKKSKWCYYCCFHVEDWHLMVSSYNVHIQKIVSSDNWAEKSWICGISQAWWLSACYLHWA